MKNDHVREWLFVLLDHFSLATKPTTSVVTRTPDLHEDAEAQVTCWESPTTTAVSHKGRHSGPPGLD